jgi:hypothetical protein
MLRILLSAQCISMNKNKHFMPLCPAHLHCKYVGYYHYADGSLAAVRATHAGHVLTQLADTRTLTFKVGGWAWRFPHLVKLKLFQNPGNRESMA